MIYQLHVNVLYVGIHHLASQSLWIRINIFIQLCPAAVLISIGVVANRPSLRFRWKNKENPISGGLLVEEIEKAELCKDSRHTFVLVAVSGITSELQGQGNIFFFHIFLLIQQNTGDKVLHLTPPKPLLSIFDLNANRMLPKKREKQKETKRRARGRQRPSNTKRRHSRCLIFLNYDHWNINSIFTSPNPRVTFFSSDFVEGTNWKRSWWDYDLVLPGTGMGFEDIPHPSLVFYSVSCLPQTRRALLVFFTYLPCKIWTRKF